MEDRAQNGNKPQNVLMLPFTIKRKKQKKKNVDIIARKNEGEMVAPSV